MGSSPPPPDPPLAAGVPEPGMGAPRATLFLGETLVGLEPFAFALPPLFPPPPPPACFLGVPFPGCFPTFAPIPRTWAYSSTVSSFTFFRGMSTKRTPSCPTSCRYAGIKKIPLLFLPICYTNKDKVRGFPDDVLVLVQSIHLRLRISGGHLRRVVALHCVHQLVLLPTLQ